MRKMKREWKRGEPFSVTKVQISKKRCEHHANNHFFIFYKLLFCFFGKFRCPFLEKRIKFVKNKKFTKIYNFNSDFLTVSTPVNSNNTAINNYNYSVF